MARAQTKQQLLDFGENEYQTLMKLVDSFTPSQQVTIKVFENRTIKDILAHLTDWIALVLTWEIEGENGGKPHMPAEGYTWKELPAFNEMLYQKSKDKTLDAVMQDFKKNHIEAMQHIAAYSASDIETKAKFAWTGSTNIVSYYASCTASHYVWAIALLKKLKKSMQ